MLRRTGNKINLFFLRIDEVDHDMPVWANPLGGPLDCRRSEQPRGKYRAVGDTPGESRLLSAVHRFANDRVNTIRSNHAVRVGPGPVSENEVNSISILVEVNELLAQVNKLSGYGRNQGF